MDYYECGIWTKASVAVLRYIDTTESPLSGTEADPRSGSKDDELNELTTTIWGTIMSIATALSTSLRRKEEVDGELKHKQE